MSDSRKSIFYKDAFDTYISVAEEQDQRNKIIEEGYILPDIDGARSTTLRNYAATNNTFDEKALKDSLDDLYNNSSYKLIASNTDNVHFYKWEGCFADWSPEEHTKWYRMILPWNMFITPGERDIFKISRFYHRWITATELMNNWSVFKWMILIFINQRVASNYEIWIEEQEVTIRVMASSRWTRADLPIYLYKFDTNFQYRVRVSYNELHNRLNWEYPFERLGDLLSGTPKVILTFNHTLPEGSVSDREISETLGHNLEFMNVNLTTRKIDVGVIHPLNVRYLLSQPTEAFWMGIISPKFLHEYPVLLPSDVIYRPASFAMEPVAIPRNGKVFHMKVDQNQTIKLLDSTQSWKKVLRGKKVQKFNWWEIKKRSWREIKEGKWSDLLGEYEVEGIGPILRDEEDNILYETVEELYRDIDLEYPRTMGIDYTTIPQQIYIDRYGETSSIGEGWFSMVRPIVLSDAFRSPDEPYDMIKRELDLLERDIINFTNTVEEFSYYVRKDSEKNSESWTKWMELLNLHGKELRDKYLSYHYDRRCPVEDEVIAAFIKYFEYVSYLRVGGVKNIKLPPSWFQNTRYLIKECHKLTDRFAVKDIIADIPRRFIWYQQDEFKGQQRFLRPVDESSFWIFEYDPKQQTWFPTDRKVTRHFPDVYLLTSEEAIPGDRIFKSFFFYSDTMNVLQLSKDHTLPKPQYDEELMTYQEARAEFKDIFLEKFYWLAIQAVYNGILLTKNRWEVLEYILGNNSFRRYNELFLNTLDPYFKYGLATQLRGHNSEFPFDEAIEKLNEQMLLQRNGYNKVNSLEYYLKHQWVPSYFDYLDQFLSDYNFQHRLWSRPPITFDLRQLRREIQRMLDGLSVNSILEDLLPLLSLENFTAVKIQLLRDLYAALNGLPYGFKIIISYIDQREEGLFNTNEMIKLNEWLTSFAWVGKELKIRLQQVQADLPSPEDYPNYESEKVVIFTQILSILERGLQLLPILEQYAKRIQIISQAIRDFKLSVIPDAVIPDYGIVFAAQKILVDTPGFNYELGEIVFIPKLGSFKVTLTDSDSGVLGLSPYGYQQSFQNPLKKSSYTTGSTLDGMGLKILCEEVTITEVMDNAVVFHLVEKMYSNIRRLAECSEILNLNNNESMHKVLEQIPSFSDQWELIVSNYPNHLSLEVKSNLPLALDIFQQVQETGRQFLNFRGKCEIITLLTAYQYFIGKFCNIGNFVRKFWNLINEESWHSLDLSGLLDFGMRALQRLQAFTYVNPWVDRFTLGDILSDIEYLMQNYRDLTVRFIWTLTQMTNASYNQWESVKSRLIQWNNMDETTWDDIRMDILAKAEEIHTLSLDLPADSHRVNLILMQVISSLESMQNRKEKMAIDFLKLRELLDAISFTDHEVFYGLTEINVSERGQGYQVGDFLSLQLEEMEYFFLVSVADRGKVLAVEALMEYAFPERIWGYYETTTLRGTGSGLSLTLYSQRGNLFYQTSFNSLRAQPSFLPSIGGKAKISADLATPVKIPDQWGSTDLMAFRFENIHDLNMSYEVFLGGEQIPRFIQRHDDTPHKLWPSKVDTIYLPANLFSKLQGVSITISPEHHVIYQIDDIQLLDPGSGYYEGQDLYINVGTCYLKLMVAKLLHEPFKGIAKFTYEEGMTFQDIDPQSGEISALGDQMLNIDDEFSEASFDHLRWDEKERKVYSETGIVREDPEEKRFSGIRMANSLIPVQADLVYTLQEKQDVSHPILMDEQRQDFKQPPFNNYLLLTRCSFHKGPIIFPPLAMHQVENTWGDIAPQDWEYWGGKTWEDVYGSFIPWSPVDPDRETLTLLKADTEVKTLADRPKFPADWSGWNIGKKVGVTRDESKMGHRTIYTIIGISLTGLFRYDLGVVADYAWNELEVSWMNIDTYDSYPNTMQQYPEIKWDEVIRWYSEVEVPIILNKYKTDPDFVNLKKNLTAYLHELSIDDLSVFNYSLKEWEDLTDVRRWKLETYHEPEIKKWGFKLTFLGVRPEDEKDRYAFDMLIYLNKKPSNQQRNRDLISPAKFTVLSSVLEEIDLEGATLASAVGKTIRIRKLFPYYQRAFWAIGPNLLPSDEIKPDDDQVIMLPVEFTATPDTLVSTGGLITFAVELVRQDTHDLEIIGPALESEGKYTNPGIIIQTGQNISFQLNEYMHFRNEIHLEDIKLYNRLTQKFESVLDVNTWEVAIPRPVPAQLEFRPDKLIHKTVLNFSTTPDVMEAEAGLINMYIEVIDTDKLPDSPPRPPLYLTQPEFDSRVTGYTIIKRGSSFTSGYVWGYNQSNDVHLYGRVVSYNSAVRTFLPLHFNKSLPAGSYDFEIYQSDHQARDQASIIRLEFTDLPYEAAQEPYIHNITNPMTPIKKKVILSPKLPSTSLGYYEVFIDLTARKFPYLSHQWQIKPAINITGWQCQEDRWYLLVNNRRYPIINPITKQKTLIVEEHDQGVQVTYNGLYRPHEPMEFCTLPYPVRSVYQLAQIPRSGYLDLSGKLNKPLSKHHYEFWVNGKLLSDELTIVSPSKLILHGLTSLRNLEILEINRDPHEYFSDVFLGVKYQNDRPFPYFNYRTYLDDAIEGNRAGEELDRFSSQERNLLLDPVYPQVPRDHSSYKEYPENTDTERNIFQKIYSPNDIPIPDNLDLSPYLNIDGPTLEGLPFSGNNTDWSAYGLREMTEEELNDLLNQVWSEEILSGRLPSQGLSGDDHFSGSTVSHYNKFGTLTQSEENTSYSIPDSTRIDITTLNKEITITKK